MVEKGLREGDISSIADDLEKEAQQGDSNLDTIEKAVELVGPNMGKNASVRGEFSGSAGSSDLTQFIMS